MASHPSFERLTAYAFSDVRNRLILHALRQVNETKAIWTLKDVIEVLRGDVGALGPTPDYVHGLARTAPEDLAQDEFEEHCETLTAPDGATTQPLPQNQSQSLQRHLEALASELERDHLAAATRKAYLHALKDYAWWTMRHRLDDRGISEDVVALYLTDCADQRWFLSQRHGHQKLVLRTLKYASINTRLAALRYAAGRILEHGSLAAFAYADDIGRSNPRIMRLMQTIRHQIGIRTQSKYPFTWEEIQSMADWISTRRLPPYSESRQDELNLRDRALLLSAYVTGRRRCVLAGLRIENLKFDLRDTGVELLIPRQNVDQTGKAQRIYVAALDSRYCPVSALRNHLGRRQRGPVFQRLDHAAERSPFTGDSDAITGQTVNHLIKKAAEAIGLDPRKYGAHSMRHSMATNATEAGTPMSWIMMTGGWTSLAGNQPHRTVHEVRRAALTGHLVR